MWLGSPSELPSMSGRFVVVFEAMLQIKKVGVSCNRGYKLVALGRALGFREGSRTFGLAREALECSSSDLLT